MKYNTIREACEEWVNRMNFIPMSVVGKLVEANWEDMHEITPPCVGDRVYIWEEKEYGNILETNNDIYTVELESDSKNVYLSREDFEVDKESCFPMWGTMFEPEDIDKDWILGNYCESHLQEVANCGFRIYESEDFGILLGIDGAGYDFYESHWIPLYNARELKWHKETA